jgi:CRP/FNR family transcriptional regulator, nitrogen fixation regulation protein
MLRLRGQSHSASAHVSGILLKFRKGEIVYAQGDPATDWYEVITGTVRTCYLYANGHRQLTGFYYPGDVFGIEAGTHEASAEAVTSATLRRIDRNGRQDQSLARFVGHSPALNAPPPSPNSALESALKNAQDCIFLLGHRTAAERMAAFLLATSRRIGRDKPFQLPMSRSDIADYLGLTIHTVSRTLSDFVRRGLITLNGPQIMSIDNRAGLQAIEGRDEEEDCMEFSSELAMLTQQGGANNIHQIGR